MKEQCVVLFWAGIEVCLWKSEKCGFFFLWHKWGTEISKSYTLLELYWEGGSQILSFCKHAQEGASGLWKATRCKPLGSNQCQLWTCDQRFSISSHWKICTTLCRGSPPKAEAESSIPLPSGKSVLNLFVLNKNGNVIYLLWWLFYDLLMKMGKLETKRFKYVGVFFPSILSLTNRYIYYTSPNLFQTWDSCYYT